MEIKCPACNQFIAADAKFCPSCGRPMATVRHSKPPKKSMRVSKNITARSMLIEVLEIFEVCVNTFTEKILKDRTKTLIVVLLLSIMIAAIFGPKQSENSTPVPPPTVENKRSDNDPFQQALFVGKGKAAVKEKLKDPDSANFRNTFFHMSGKGLPFACGEVNSKNSFGAYGGYQKFISMGAAELTYFQEETADFVESWNDFCVN